MLLDGAALEHQAVTVVEREDNLKRRVAGDLVHDRAGRNVRREPDVPHKATSLALEKALQRALTERELLDRLDAVEHDGVYVLRSHLPKEPLDVGDSRIPALRLGLGVNHNALAVESFETLADMRVRAVAVGGVPEVDAKIVGCRRSLPPSEGDIPYFSLPIKPAPKFTRETCSPVLPYVTLSCTPYTSACFPRPFSPETSIAGGFAFTLCSTQAPRPAQNMSRAVPADSQHGIIHSD